MSKTNILPVQSQKKMLSLVFDGRSVSLEMPLRPGTYEHLSDAEQFEIANFIRLKSQRSQETPRQYVAQLERFLVWMKLKDLSTIDEWALMDYQQALLNPEPALLQQNLVSFQPTTPETVDQYLQVIRSFCNHLFEKKLLHYNPGKQLPALGVRHREGDDSHKIFNAEQWPLLLAAIDALPGNTKRERNERERYRFCLRFQYAMALRVSEMANHNHSHIRRHGNKWRLHIVGKGLRARVLTLDDFALEALTRYRTFLGLSPLPPLPQKKDGGVTDNEPEKHLPLLPTVSPVTVKTRGPNKGTDINEKTISRSNWQRQFKALLENEVADYVTEHTGEHHKEWSGLTPHSLRHTRITHLVDQGKELPWVQRYAGHVDINTTAHYYHATL